MVFFLVGEQHRALAVAFELSLFPCNRKVVVCKHLLKCNKLEGEK